MSTLINITDTPVEIEVLAGATATPEWGDITGTLSNQTDLQNALNAKVPYSGATGNVDLGEYELKAGQIELDQSPTGTAGVAVTRWNDSVGTIETTLKGGSVVLKHGRDMFERVVNKTGIQLTRAAYQAVRVSDAQGQRLAVDLAQANNDNNSADTIGLVVETIDNNQEGIIYTVGEIDGINTTGSLQGETWTDGDVLYLSPTTAGRITNVKPIAPQHLVVIGYVVYAHANNGKIYVKVMNGWELGELHDVNTTGATNGQVLKYNGTIWTPSSDTGITSLNGLTALSQTFATGTSGTDFNISSATSTHTFNLPSASATNRGLLTSADWTTFNNKQNALTNPITGTGTSGQVAYFTGSTTQSGSNNLFWDNANGRLGIGTNTPQSPLEILTNSGRLTMRQSVAGGTFGMNFRSSANVLISSLTVNESSGAITLSAGNGYWLDFQAGGVQAMRIEEVSRNVMIGSTTNSGQRLQVTGSTILTNTSLNYQLRLSDGSFKWDLVCFANVTNTDLRFVDNSGNNAMILYNGGNVSIGNNLNNARLSVSGTARITSTLSVDSIRVGFATGNNAPFIFSFNTNPGIPDSSFRNLSFYSYTGSNSATGGAYNFTGDGFTQTSGNQKFIFTTNSFIPTSGTSTLDIFAIAWTINQTGGANGITRGLYVNPTLTAAADWRSIEWSNNSGWGLYGAGAANNYLAGNLGIGVTVPAGGIDVNNPRSYFRNSGSTGTAIRIISTFTNGRDWGIGSNYVSGNGEFSIYDYTANAERMRLDASGNLGLGLSPVSSLASWRSFEMARGSQLFVNSNGADLHLSNNAYYNGGWKRGVGNLATDYNQYAGIHSWLYAVNGAADQAINWVETMRLSNIGNLMLQNGGTYTDSGERLQVNGTMKVTGASTFGGNIDLTFNQNAYTFLNIRNTTSGTGSVAYLGLTSNSSAGAAQFGKQSSTTTTYKTLVASDAYIYNGTTAGNLCILNDFASGNINFAAGGSSTAHFTIASSGAATFSSSVTSTQFRLSALNTAPATASSTGTLGEIIIDADYIYICTATNTWKRVAIATW